MRAFLYRLRNFENPFAREKVLGVSKGKRRYDLPLSGSSNNTFLRLLIALMSVLGMLALAASFALGAMTDRWSQGLANKVSVEIPAADSGGDIIEPGIVKSMTDEAAKILNEDKDVHEAVIMEESDVRELLSPWLGNDMVMDSIPIPGLISVTFDADAKPDLKKLEARLKEAAPRARIDTHETWLSEVMRFTGALQFSAALLGLIIGATTLVAVAGGVRSKLSENKEELELLHLMGASDSYIANQLQRHTLILSLQGGVCGVLAGGLLLFVISLIAGNMGVNLVPGFTLDNTQKSLLLFLPLPIAILAMITARFTVLRVLTKMP
ncbi:MAG: permease [Micavibrio aeruginosavorus]|uniref:Permease n=1 Tax=Micavibrio aeruginosavorus TaxID=349221 RepID=A0A2W5MZ92_9BACT|nr:MAG: permease [Micavibrio aeruginosavorus]